MSNNNNNIKPFYIYTDRNCLYIKNINECTEKLSSNIYAYSANIDLKNNIHICCLDTSGKLIHFYSDNGLWRKKTLHRCFNSLRNVKDMRLYIVDNLLNIFIVEKSPLSDTLHKVSHFYFDPRNYKLNRHNIDNVFKDKQYIYKLNIDDFSNIVFEYKSKGSLTRSITNNILIFNTASKRWLGSNSLSRENINKANSKQRQSNIRDDVFEYCYSIKYKI